jgi:hypothetical protein
MLGWQNPVIALVLKAKGARRYAPFAHPRDNQFPQGIPSSNLGPSSCFF